MKLLAVSIALLIIVSGVMPCIAVDNPANKAVSKEIIEPNDTIQAQHQMPFSSLPINEHNLVKDTNASIPDKTEVNAATDSVLWSDGFESYPVGSFPSDWTQSGNAFDTSNNHVVASPVASGSKALKLKGVAGSCWEALAFHDLLASTTESLTISFDIYTTTEGSEGCHGKKNGGVILYTGPSWTYSGRTLITFTTEGKVLGSGIDLGTYTVGIWTHADIAFQRVNSDSVKLSYWINGEFKGSVTVDALSYEDDLTYLSIDSGDFTVYYDNIQLAVGDQIPKKIAFYSDYKSISNTTKTTSGLSYYADALIAKGYTVEQIYGPITSSKLDEYGALLIIGLTEYLSSTEKSAIEDFVVNKGRGLLIAGGDTYNGRLACNDLAGVFTGGSIASFGDYIVCDPTDYEVYPKWIKIQTFYEHPITENLNKIIMYKGTNIPIAWTYGPIVGCAYSDDDSWLDENGNYVYDSGESRGVQPVLANHIMDKIVIVPDANVFDNSDGDGDGIVAFNEYDNDVLGLNIVKWFVGEGEEEIKFTGTVTGCSPLAIGFRWWNVTVDEVISGPQPCSTEITVSWLAYPPVGYFDPNITIGDKVEVYGRYYEDQYGCNVSLNGKEEYYIKKIETPPKTIYVDDDFIDDPPNHKWNTIQEGITDADENDTIFVYSGIYYSGKGHGDITITKNGLKLIGEDRNTTIIDGCGELSVNVITLTSSNCLITNFTIRNSGWDNCAGIRVEYPSSYNEISNNNISYNFYGILTSRSDNNTIRNNLISNNYYYGMYIWNSKYNTIIENNILNNDERGIYTHSMYCYNSFYHNNFINNEIQAVDEDFEINYWNSQEIMEGNYWSDYEEKYPDAEEIGDTGIWDTPYEVHGYYNFADPKDYYPLVEPWGGEEEPQTPFTFVHLTDVHIGFLGIYPEDMVEPIEKFTDTLQDVKTHNPDFILNTGDIVEFNYPDFFKAYAEIIKSISISIPLYHTPGNHDSRDSDTSEINLLNYYLSIGSENPDSNSLNDGYHGYYFDKHGYRFVGLDSGRDYSYYDGATPEGSGLTDSQNESLNDADMKGHPRKIIFMHHPVINDCNDGGALPVENYCWWHDGNDMCIAFHRCDFIDYCIINNVDLVLTGHTHKDYVKTIPNNAGTHETWFIQTRSATKDAHGYRVIDINDGVISTSSKTTPSPFDYQRKTITLSKSNWQENPPTSYWGISAYDLDNRHTGVNETTGNIEREIPDSYYTGYYDKPPMAIPQVLVAYPGISLKVKYHEVTPIAGVSNMIQEPTTSSEEIYLNFSIRDHTGSEIIEYRYDNVALTDYSTASVDLTSPEPDYTMEVDYYGDGTEIREIEPEIETTGVVIDTESGTYPSIAGVHTGTITPNKNITVSKLYTYPCEGTGGHTEYVHIFGNAVDKSASWSGYEGDWHNLTFGESFMLEAGETYYYEIRTGSYPQIHHNMTLLTANGWINCTSFEDANGNVHTDWIPAIKLFL